jgi:hypothetical protein
MKTKFTADHAGKTVLIILSFSLIYHILILSGVVGYGATWGGRLKSQEEMLRFESVSIAVTLLVMVATGIRIGLLRIHIAPTLLRIFFYLLTLLFALNTLGNLVAVDNLEKYIATPLTAVLTLCCWVLAKDGK